MVATWKARIDEENTSIEPDAEINDGKYHPLPNLLTRYPKADKFTFNPPDAAVEEGQIALPLSVVGGADLWSDPRIGDLHFFPDRRHLVIEGAKLKSSICRSIQSFWQVSGMTSTVNQAAHQKRVADKICDPLRSKILVKNLGRG